MKKLSVVFVFLVLIALHLASGVPVFAQTPGDLHFLETFAIRVYERGDVLQAKKEFERILKIDPANATAKKYLDQIVTAKPQTENLQNTTVLNRLSDITNDIKGLKAEILTYENDAKQLCETIRHLLSENDSLYVALRKRTRDLADLNEKFRGTPYNDQYQELMKDLPPDRVPQRVRPINDVLPDVRLVIPSAASATQQEVEALTQEVAQTEAALKDLKAAPNMDPLKISALETVLREKRSLLSDKTAALIENRNNLLNFKGQLMTLNGSLKEADQRYTNALINIEKIAQEIRPASAPVDEEGQKKYRALLSDYAEKIKEVDQLKRSLAERDMTTGTIETALADKKKNIETIDAALRDKDREMEEYRALLSRLKEDLAQKEKALAEKEKQIAAQDKTIGEKETVISTQSEDLKFADGQLQNVDQKISSIQGLLKENDNDIARLQAGFSKVKALMQNETTAVQNTAEEDPFQAQINELTRALTDKNDALALLKLKLKDVEQELEVREKEALQKDDDTLALQEKILSLEKKLIALEEQNAALQKIGRPVSIEKPKTDDTARLTGEITDLHNILSAKDKTIVELNKKIIEKNVEARELSAMVEACQTATEDKSALIRENALLKTRLTKSEEEKKLLGDSRCALQSSELDMKERDIMIKDLQYDLGQKTAALKAAAQQISALEESLAVIKIKQSAIKELVDKKDKELADIKQKLEKDAKDSR